MKKSLIYLLFLLLPLEPLASQVLKGVVLDSRTKESVINANVYLEGTSSFTITDADGYFELKVNKRVNTRLIISHVAYHSFTADKPYEELPEVILLDEKENRISEVVVQGEKPFFSRKQMLRAFKDQFLGTTKAGRSCLIRNEEAIAFYYDQKKHLLKAFCDEPIVIENKYLGYVVSMELLAFEAEFYDVSLWNEALKRVLYLGPTSYQDVSGGNLTMLRRRRDVYRGSQKEFFHLLIHKKLKKSAYSIPSISFEKLFVVEDNPKEEDVKILCIHPDYVGYQDVILPFADSTSTVIAVKHKQQQTYIEFKADTYVSDLFGNVYDVRDLVLTGEMSKRRMGDMLPLDYEAEGKE